MILTDDDPVKIWRSVCLLGWALRKRFSSELDNLGALISDCYSELADEQMLSDIETVTRQDIRDRLSLLIERMHEFEDFILSHDLTQGMAEFQTPYSLDLHVYHVDLAPRVWYRLDRDNAGTCFQDLAISSPEFSINDAELLYELFAAITVPPEDDEGWERASSFEISCLMARDRVLNIGAHPPSPKPTGRPKGSSPNAHHWDAIEPIYFRHIATGSSKRCSAKAALEELSLPVTPPTSDKTQSSSHYVATNDNSALNAIVTEMDKRKHRHVISSGLVQ